MFWAPDPTASMAITAATPITMPRIVNPDLSLLPFKVANASSIACPIFIFHYPFQSVRHKDGLRVSRGQQYLDRELRGLRWFRCFY